MLVVALALVIGLRAAVSLRGYLYMDDFAFRYWAMTSPLNTEYLFRSYGGHVNPVGLAVQWLLQWLWPGSHLALAGFSLLAFALSLGLFAAILMRLTARPLAVLIGVVVAGISLFGFEVTVWWAASIYAAPYQLFLLASLYCALRVVAGDGIRWEFLGLICGLGLVLSFSRAFVAIPLVFALSAALPRPGGDPGGLSATFATARRFWLAQAVVMVVGAAVVLSSAGDITRPGFSVRALPGYSWNLLVLNILPAVWGGPWRWFEVPAEQWDSILANPAPPWWAVWVAGVLSAVMLVALWKWRPRLRFLTVVVVSYVMAVILMAGIARSGTPVASVAYRYTFDLVWPFTLLLTLAIVPVRDESRGLWRPGLVLVGLTTALALFSTLIPARDWAGNQAKEYMANAVSGFRLIQPGQTVLDQGVPNELIPPAFMAPYANSRTVMTPQPGAPAFGDYAADRLFGFAADGHVEVQDVQGPTSPPGPDEGCGYRVSDVPRTIPLNGELIAWDFYARVAYFTGEPTTLNMAVGGKIHTVPLETGGIRAVYFPVKGPGTDVLVSAGTPGATVCVTEVRIGNRVALGTSDVVPLPIHRLAG